MNRRGVTLIELLVSMFILSLLGGVMYTIYTSAGRFTNDEQNRIEVDLSANRILTVMDEYLRQGARIEPSYTAGLTTYTTGDTTLVFMLPSVDPVTPGSLDTAVFYLDGTDLKLLIDASDGTRQDGTQVITSVVTDLYFRYNASVMTSATAVALTLRTGKVIFGHTYSQLFILSETLLNHA